MAGPEQIHFKLLRPGDVERLLAECFPVPPGGSFFDDFPLWQDSTQAEWLGIVDPKGDGTRVLGCAGRVSGDWHVPGGNRLIKVARIGGVATAPELRGRGLAGGLVEELLARARAEGAEVAVLWGMESNLYARLGFAGRGRQVRIPVRALVEPGRAPGIHRLEEGFAPEILPLMMEARSHTGGIRLTPGDAGWIARHRNTRWARVLDGEGRIVAYGAFGRGMDLGYQLHDWGGSGEALDMLLRWALSQDASAEIMGPFWLMKELWGHCDPEALHESACMLLELEPGSIPADDGGLWFWGLDGV